MPLSSLSETSEHYPPETQSFPSSSILIVIRRLRVFAARENRTQQHTETAIAGVIYQLLLHAAGDRAWSQKEGDARADLFDNVRSFV